MLKLAMAGEFDQDIETKTSGGKPSDIGGITLQKAIDMGEYDPNYLANFPDWHKLSKIMKWQMIRQAIKNRRNFLRIQWAEINNQLDYSQKPYLAKAAKNVEKQLDELTIDEEKYQVEYSL